MPIACYVGSTSDSFEQVQYTNVHTSLVLRNNKHQSGSKLGRMPYKNVKL